ncbi:hypothetical protein F383_35398 [Gossypium arboreum]|uniref:Uncharacterized protein n=1 Tax=Gossypium arboreum TaxID=29729 RepID=A0A0B0N8E8_GOSAR|nr:hypothetical protein F383_35398 [Gossypium arboreum]
MLNVLNLIIYKSREAEIEFRSGKKED